ncbi:MAG: DoxX family membrane protein [Bacteroidia bacterium]|jgi:uncharacterized membrane protein|nr:DoxX family membrane protein [Bacteroidia bacterium]
MKNLTNIGRIIYGLPFVIFGLNHLMGADGMAGMVPSFIPGGIVWIYVTGLAELAAGIAIISKKYIRLATLLLACLIGVYILTIHIPGLGSADEMGKIMSMVMLLKDLGLAGAALMISGLHADEQ